MKESVDRLGDIGKELVGAVRSLEGRTKRSEIGLAISYVLIVVDVLLSIFLVVSLVNQSDATRQLQQVQQNGAQVRQQVLCPLYQLLVSSYSTRARDAYPQGAAAYDHAFAVLRDSTKILNCHS
jgi:hypothetical protein